MLNNITPILESIHGAKAKCGATLLITIDGPAGSGKTVLAQEISDALSTLGQISTTIHMDSLYDGWENALTSSLTTMLRKRVAGTSSLDQTGRSKSKLLADSE